MLFICCGPSVQRADANCGWHLVVDQLDGAHVERVQPRGDQRSGYPFPSSRMADHRRSCHISLFRLGSQGIHLLGHGKSFVSSLNPKIDGSMD